MYVTILYFNVTTHSTWSYILFAFIRRFITIFASGGGSGFDLRTLRAVRVLRPLKLVSGVPSKCTMLFSIHPLHQPSIHAYRSAVVHLIVWYNLWINHQIKFQSGCHLRNFSPHQLYYCGVGLNIGEWNRTKEKHLETNSWMVWAVTIWSYAMHQILSYVLLQCYLNRPPITRNKDSLIIL